MFRKLLFSIILACSAAFSYGQTAIFSQFLDFNGNNITSTGDYVEVADNPTLDFNASQSFTIQFWINPIDLNTTLGSVQGIVTKREKSDIGYGVFWNGSGGGNGNFQLRLTDSDVPNDVSNFSSSNIANPGTLGWIHLTFILKRNSAPAEDTAYVYLNGELDQKKEVLQIDDLSNNLPLVLMSFENNIADDCAGGFLDEVRIWNVALSERQIYRLYNEPIEEGLASAPGGLGVVHGKITGRYTLLLWNKLVGYWDMEDVLGGAAITDKSNNSNDGVFFDGPSGTPCVAAPCGPEIKVGSIGESPSTFIASVSGNWSSAATWGGNGVPTSDRHIAHIIDGVTVTLDGNFDCEDITIESGATFICQSGSILNVHKFFDVDGVFNNNFGTIRFTGNGDHKVDGESGTIEFYNFDMDQANSQIQINTPIRINGILYHTNGRIRTEDNITLSGISGDPSLPYAMIDPSGNPDIEGLIKMEKELSNTNAGWRQLCMPMAGFVSGVNIGFEGLPLNTSGSANASNPNIFFWDNASDVGGTPANNVGWTQSNENDDETKPFSLYLANPTFPFTTSFSFKGNYNPGDHDYPITYYNDPGNPIASGQLGYENGVGWNFIPNPYPSLLVANTMLADNPLTYNNIHFWDALSQQYRAFTAVHSSIIPYNNTGATAFSPFASLQPFQGFWVKTSSLAESGINFTVKGAWRSTNYAIAPHPSLKQELDVALINVYSAADSAWDGVSIAFASEAKSEFDPKADVYKLFSPSNVPSLFLEKDERWLMVNTIPSSVQQVKLHFMPQGENDQDLYYIHLNQAHLAEGKSVLIEDLATKNVHDLIQGDYAFKSHGFNGSDRFIVHFINAKHPFYGLNNLSNLNAYPSNDKIIIESAGLEGIASLYITDMAGRLLVSEKIELGSEASILAPELSGVVLLTAQSILGTRTIKLTLTK